jgi:hypothetical protein
MRALLNCDMFTRSATVLTFDDRLKSGKVCFREAVMENTTRDLQNILPRIRPRPDAAEPPAAKAASVDGRRQRHVHRR